MSKNITDLLNKIKTYVDTKDASHESDANNYTDAEIGNLNASLGDGTKLVSTITEENGKLKSFTGPDIITRDTDIDNSANIPTSGAIKTYTDKLVIAESNRASGIEDGLQLQINNLKSVQNVAEVVGTKAELDALPKAAYDVDDKVQVIADESREDAPTFVYKLNADKNAWVPVGAYGGNSYTKTQANALLAEKVDKTTTVNGHALSANISLDKTDIGLARVDNTNDLEKPVSTATQTELNKKVDKTITINNHALSSNVEVTKADVGLGSVDNKSAATLKSEFTGAIAANNNGFVIGNDVYNHTSNTNNPHAVTKAQVGLGNVDNTSDAAKPISNATQAALDLKANQATTYTKTEVDALIEAANEDIADINEFLDDTPLDVDYVVKEDPITHANVKGLYKTGRDTTAYSLIVDLTTLKTDLELNNVTNNRQVKAINSAVSGNILTFDGTDGATIQDSGKTFTTSIAALIANASDIKLPTEKAVKTELDKKEDIANRVTNTTGWSTTANLSDAKYPTEKLVKLSLDLKANLTGDNAFNGNNTFTGANVFIGDAINGTTFQNSVYMDDLSINGAITASYMFTTDDTKSNIFKGNTTFTSSTGSLQSRHVDFDLVANFKNDAKFIDSNNITTSANDLSDIIWSDKKAYAVGDIIFYNRALYICELAVSASSAGNMDPATDTTHWTRLFTNQA